MTFMTLTQTKHFKILLFGDPESGHRDVIHTTALSLV